METESDSEVVLNDHERNQNNSIVGILKDLTSLKIVLELGLLLRTIISGKQLVVKHEHYTNGTNVLTEAPNHPNVVGEDAEGGFEHEHNDRIKCAQRTTTRAEINTNLMLQEENGKKREKPMKSLECRKFCSKSNLLSAKQLKRQATTKTHACQVCNKTFHQKWELNKHMRTHTGEKPFKCELCQWKFSQSSNLTRHMRVHTGEKPYKCNTCHKTLSSSSHCRRHEKTHAGLKSFKCKLCQQTFTLRDTLYTHMRVHTRENPCWCNDCNKEFSSHDQLKLHQINAHSRDTAHQCIFCAKKFAYKSHHYRHILSHVHEKP